MGNKPYLVQCTASKYDEEDEMMVLFCMFKDVGEHRVLCFHRSDFHFKDPDNPAPHAEMQKMTQMFIGKHFNIIIEDDPNRVKIDETNQEKYLSMFKDRMVEEMEAVQDGMKDDKQRLQRYIGDLVEREKQKKEIDIDKIISEEAVIRQRLSSVRFDT